MGLALCLSSSNGRLLFVCLLIYFLCVFLCIVVCVSVNLLSLLWGCKITIISGCGYSFRCGTSTSVCSVLPRHAHLSWRRGGGRQEGGGESFLSEGLTNPTGWKFFGTGQCLAKGSRSRCSLPAWRRYNLAKQKILLVWAACWVYFTLKQSYLLPQLWKQRKEWRGVIVFLALLVKQLSSFMNMDFIVAVCRYMMHNTKTLAHDLFCFAFGLLLA